MQAKEPLPTVPPTHTSHLIIDLLHGLQAKQPLPTDPPTHTSQLIIDLLHEPSEVVLMEELDSIKKILDPKTPIVWMKEILISELWEEELFQGGDVPLSPGLQTTWIQLSYHLGNYHQIPEATTRVW